jgi:hypothetical protein
LKHLARYFSLLVLTTSFSLLANAQDFRVESKSPPTPAGSETFTSLEGRFSIVLPQQVSGFKGGTSSPRSGQVTGDTYEWRRPEGYFSVTYLDRPEILADPATSKSILDSFRAEFLARANTAKGKLISESNLSLGKYPGRELKAEVPNGLVIQRVYLVSPRMYLLTAGLNNSQRSQEEAVTKILDSFRALNQTEVEAALRKKVEDAQPSPLPQEPVAKKLKSDAEDEGLKGKVKSIVSRRADLVAAEGKLTEGKLEPSSSEYYNEQGNLTKRESYDWQGNPRDISVYGYIDGERASNYKSIRYEYDPPPMMLPPPPAGQPKPTYDPRYSSKYKYRYDDKGKMAEKLLYGNDGKLRLRYVYNYNGNQKEELVYTAEGKLNQKYVSVIDDKGNETEETTFEAKDDSIRSKYSYSYEFDTKGNWIKRIASKWVTKDGKSFFEPAWVTYRTITYY